LDNGKIYRRRGKQKERERRGINCTDSFILYFWIGLNPDNVVFPNLIMSVLMRRCETHIMHKKKLKLNTFVPIYAS
jgi:hypothetical protein